MIERGNGEPWAHFLSDCLLSVHYCLIGFRGVVSQASIKRDAFRERRLDLRDNGAELEGDLTGPHAA